MMEKNLPYWVSNDRKYNRALSELKKNNLSVTEDALKALYIKYGGLVLEKLTDEEIQAEEAAVAPVASPVRVRRPRA